MGTETGLGPVGEAEVSMMEILGSDFRSDLAANEELWEVDAVGSPRVRAMM